MTIAPTHLHELSFAVRGTVHKGTPDETIYQRTFYGQQKYSGPRAQPQPRVQNQMLSRVRFRAALAAADNLTAEQREYFRSLIKPHERHHTWRTKFIELFLRGFSYGQSTYGAGLYSQTNPPVPAGRYGYDAYGDGFYLPSQPLPIPRQYGRDVYGSGYFYT